MNYQTIGEKIKRHKSFRGKKQEAFASEIGVSRIMMSQYENGHVKMEVQLLLLICQKLEITITELLKE